MKHILTEIGIYETTQEMARSAALLAAERLDQAIARKGHATLIAPAGNSQLELLDRSAPRAGRPASPSRTV